MYPIKRSGKTVPLFFVENVKINKKMVGFKAAGGIRIPEEAIAYAIMAENIMGDGYISNQTFRIGASSLTNNLYESL